MAKHQTILDFYHEQTKDVASELAMVLTLHLCTEYWINALLAAKKLIGKDLVKDSRSYIYAVKRSIVYSMGLIPMDLHDNLKKLNTIRNAAAHDLHFSLLRAEKDLTGQDGTTYSKWQESNPPAVFAWLEYVTFIGLTMHCVVHHLLPGAYPPQPA